MFSPISSSFPQLPKRSKTLRPFSAALPGPSPWPGPFPWSARPVSATARRRAPWRWRRPGPRRPWRSAARAGGGWAEMAWRNLEKLGGTGRWGDQWRIYVVDITPITPIPIGEQVEITIGNGVYQHLVGGFNLPCFRYEFVTWDDCSRKIKTVPNHQPAGFWEIWRGR